jgi:putative methyltransferase (TIGR04325 family)
MGLLKQVHLTVDRIAAWPVLLGLRKRGYDQVFSANRDSNLFRGVFESFEAAQLSAPPTRPLGYDNADAASMYIDRTRQIYSTDYPVLFWLTRLLGEGYTRFFDLGGHIGVSYYAYQRCLKYPASLSWAVHDVPAVMEQGRKFAATKDRQGHLTFCDNFEDAAHAEVFMAQGSVQYLPELLADRLKRLPKLPPNLIFNLTPLHEKYSYFTLQSIGTAFCPYRVTAMLEFLESIEALGYKMIDHWQNPEKKCEIPFFSAHSLDHYHGFYFRHDR